MLSCIYSDLGSHEDVREVSEKEPEDLGPQPQPAVITSVINHQVHSIKLPTKPLLMPSVVCLCVAGGSQQ